MRMLKGIVTAMLHDESGTAGFDWISIGVAALLFLVMTWKD